jgi:hypothetical protein
MVTSLEMPATIQPVASRWHTACIVFVIVGLGLAGRAAMTRQPVSAGASHIFAYSFGLAVQWGLLGFILLGLRRRVISPRQLMDDARWTLRRLGIYFFLALAAGVAWAICQNLLGVLLKAGPEQIRRILQAFMPHGAVENALWILLALSAGFCEEIIYRGYLLRQFRCWTGSIPLAIALQATLFGFAHAAMPWQMVVTSACYGLLLGGLAAWRRSLVPGMLLHAGFDLLVLAVR